MFGLGHGELMVILIVALLLFGTRLPAVARSLGQSFRSFKRGLQEVEPTAAEEPHSADSRTGSQ